MDPLDSKAGHIADLDEPGLSGEDSPGWMKQLWQGILDEAHGFSPDWPEWMDAAALSRFSFSTPGLLQLVKKWNEDKPYTEQVKPFNFLLIAHDSRIGPQRTTLIAPYERARRKWNQLRWIDLGSGEARRITTRPLMGGTDAVPVKTYSTVLAEYKGHREAKFLSPDGTVSRQATVGLLQRQPVEATAILHIGKESNRFEEVDLGLVHDPNDVYNVYADVWVSVDNRRLRYRSPQWPSS